MYWTYEKMDENYKLVDCPGKDIDGSITGHIVFGLKEWFDENPEERKRLGWIKHIHYDDDEIADYDRQTQYLARSTRVIDDYTVEDVFHVIPKSEQMMALEEMMEAINPEVTFGSITFI